MAEEISRILPVSRRGVKSDRLLDAIKRFVYSPDSDNRGRDSLNHSEVLKIAGEFVRTKQALREILRDGYPFILVDESQDTNKHIVAALFELQKEHKGEIVVGLFGDMMQRIYGDGQPGLGDNLPEDWATPTKQLNFRCPRRVIRLINKIREATDKQAQIPCSRAIEGHTRIFVLSSSTPNKSEAERAIAAKMAELTGDADWTAEDGVKALVVNRRRKVGQDRRRKVCHTDGCIWPVVHRVHRGDPPPLRSALALARSGGGGE